MDLRNREFYISLSGPKSTNQVSLELFTHSLYKRQFASNWKKPTKLTNECYSDTRKLAMVTQALAF